MRNNLVSLMLRCSEQYSMFIDSLMVIMKNNNQKKQLEYFMNNPSYKIQISLPLVMKYRQMVKNGKHWSKDFLKDLNL